MGRVKTENAPRTPRLRAQGLRAQRFRDARILIVGEHEPDTRVLETILARRGFGSITSTTDPDRGHDLIATSRPDLVLLDLRMPVRHSFGALEEFRGRLGDHDYVPIIVLAAESDPETRAIALRSGAQDVLTKPFNAEEVALRCRNVLETRFLYEELEAQNRILATLASSRSSQLDESRRAHESTLSSLGRLQAGDSPEETAAAVCAELARNDGFDVVGLIAFGPDDSAVTLATAGSHAIPEIVGRALPVPRARMLRERAANGPWYQTLELLPNDATAAALVTAGIRSAFYAPLTINGQIVGLLAVGVEREADDAGMAAQLPMVANHAGVARVLLAPALLARRTDAQSRSGILRIIDERAFDIVFQPVVHLADRSVIGYEALTRFHDGVRPDLRFAEADYLGLGIELEEACLGAAMSLADGLPVAAWVGLNISPGMALETARLQALMLGTRRTPVFEITEHVRVVDYSVLADSLAHVGNQRLAIDDAGAGFASFRHIVELRPDYVKIDIGLVRAIDSDPRRQALVAGLRYFATKTGCTLIAEGVETEGERSQLQDLGVLYGQGYLLGRPAGLPPAQSA